MLIALGHRSPQPEQRPATLTPTPLDVGVDHARARANVGNATASFLLCLMCIEAIAIVFNLQLKRTTTLYRRAHLNVGRARVATDVAQGLLRDTIDLNLSV